MTRIIRHLPSLSRPLTRPLAVGALLAILGLSIGGALAERMEQRATEDRLTIGDVAAPR